MTLTTNGLNAVNFMPIVLQYTENFGEYIFYDFYNPYGKDIEAVSSTAIYPRLTYKVLNYIYSDSILWNGEVVLELLPPIAFWTKGKFIPGSPYDPGPPIVNFVRTYFDQFGNDNTSVSPISGQLKVYYTGDNTLPMNSYRTWPSTTISTDSNSYTLYLEYDALFDKNRAYVRLNDDVEPIRIRTGITNLELTYIPTTEFVRVMLEPIPVSSPNPDFSFVYFLIPSDYKVIAWEKPE